MNGMQILRAYQKHLIEQLQRTHVLAEVFGEKWAKQKVDNGALVVRGEQADVKPHEAELAFLGLMEGEEK